MDGEDIFEFFKADCESDNVEYVIDSANKLTLIAVALGQERTQNELIPYLPTLISDVPEEALAAIARQIWVLYDVGQVSTLPSDSETMKTIFDTLCILADEEEMLIRDGAMKSLKKMLPTLPSDSYSVHLYPLFRTLAHNSEFGSRATSAHLLSHMYTVAPAADREELRQYLLALSQDESPIVRTAVVKLFPDLCEAITKIASKSIYYEQTLAYDVISNTVLPVLQQFALDERDHLRELVPQVLSAIIPYLPLRDYQRFIIPILTALTDDLSWRVRQNLCRYLPIFIINLHNRAIYQIKFESKLAYPNNKKEEEAYKNDIILPKGKFELNRFISGILNLYKIFLIHDINTEVRGTAVLNLVDMMYLSKGIIPDDLVKNFPRPIIHTAKATELDSLFLEKQWVVKIPPEFDPLIIHPKPTSDLFKIDHQNVLDQIGASFQDILTDISSLSRVDLCTVFTKYAPFLGFTYTNTYIVPVLSKLAHDDIAAVRTAVLLSLAPIIKVCDEENVVSQIWPVIEGLGTDLRWHVRRAVATQLTPLCSKLRSNVTFLTTSVVPLIETLISENVHAVRNRTAVEFRNLMHIFGPTLIHQTFLPWCRDLFNPKTNYLHRITAIHLIYFCITGYDNSCSTELIEIFTQYFLEALQDQVPNVRILATKYIMMALQMETPPWDIQTVETYFLQHFQTMATDHNQDRELIYQGNEAIKLISEIKGQTV